MHLHIVEKRAQIRMGLRAKRIGDGSSCAVFGFDRIQNRHIIRVAGSFKPVMLDDGRLIGCERPTAVHRLERLVEKLKVCRKSSLPETLHGFCQRLVSFQSFHPQFR